MLETLTRVPPPPVNLPCRQCLVSNPLSLVWARAREEAQPRVTYFTHAIILSAKTTLQQEKWDYPEELHICTCSWDGSHSSSVPGRLGKRER